MRGNLLKLETDVIIENTTNEQITKQLMQNYNLSPNKAEAYIRKYAQS